MLKKATVLRIGSSEPQITKVNENGEVINTYKPGSIIFSEKISPSLHLIGKEENFNALDYTKVHLHAVIEEPVYKGDFFIGKSGEPEKHDDEKPFIGLKVIASTNRLFSLPKFSKGFIQKYVETQGIDIVYVLYKEINVNGTKIYVPKTNRNNIISLRKERVLKGKEALITNALKTYDPLISDEAIEQVLKIVL